MKTLVALMVVLVSLFFVGDLFAHETKSDGILLILCDVQYEKSGLTSKNWFISESGEYEVISVVNNKCGMILRRGKLCKEQLDDLVAYIKYCDVDGMPVAIGLDFNIVNPHYIVLSWDRNNKTVFSDSTYNSRGLIMKLGQSLENAEIEFTKSDSKDAIYMDRFASIVKTIKNLCSE